MTIQVGDHVRVLRDIREQGEDLPHSVLANRGDVLVVRDISEGKPWEAYVSHPEIEDRSFGVRLEEVEICNVTAERGEETS